MVEGTDIKRSIARGFAWEGATKLTVQVVSWISTIFVARTLVPDDYGVVAISGLFTGVLSLITEFGLGAGIVTRREVSDEELNKCFWLGLAASLVLYAVIFAGAPFVAAAYDLPLLEGIMRLAGLGLLISALRIVPYSLVLRSLDYRYRALVEMFGQFIQAASTIGFAVAGFGAWSLVLGYLLAQAFNTGAFLLRARGLGRPVLTFKGIEHFIDFGVKITGARLLGFFVQTCDMMIISALLGSRVAGVYSVSFNLATAPLDKIGAVFNRVAFPAIARLKDEPERSRTLLLRLHFYLLAIASPALLGISLLAPEIVNVLLTEKWREAIPVLQILCIANIVRLSGMVMPTVLEGLGLAGKVFKYQLVSALVLPLGFAIGSQWGIRGVTAAWLVAYPVVYFWLLRITVEALGMQMRTLIASVAPVGFANLGMAACVLLMRGALPELEPWWRIVCLGLTGAAVYAALMWMLLPRTVWVELRSSLGALRS
jgi:teichuronic acid exporter